jgi:hypothetical protein
MEQGRWWQRCHYRPAVMENGAVFLLPASWEWARCDRGCDADNSERGSICFLHVWNAWKLDDHIYANGEVRGQSAETDMERCQAIGVGGPGASLIVQRVDAAAILIVKI